jgi:glycosyltransferase involved in cell wall biosynthesis
VVVTTHERPEALARVLASLAGQTRTADEIVVADDGSGPTTAEVIRRSAVGAPCAIRHVWQPHAGFRAGRARNLAIAATDCDYVVLIDGDMVIHPEFIAEHLACARRGYYSQGTRVVLDPGATRRLLAPGNRMPGPWSSGLGGLRRAYAFHALRLARMLRGAANAFVAIKSCNQGFWRDDLVAANGYDEAMRGWGSEDKELCARLENAGVRRQTLVFAAIAFHLAHPPACRSQAAANRDRLEDTIRTRRRRCELGLDQHLRARTRS